MRIPDFELERFFARWEFQVRHVLCASDVEGYRLPELLALADEETLAMWQGLSLGYTESTGHPLLRREIAGLYRDVDPEEVLVFSGAEEGIFAFFNVALSPGDHVVVTWPAYQSLHEVARAAGAEVELLPLREERSWLPDVDELRRLVRPTTRAVVVNFPHNPTGALPDAEVFREIAGVAEESGAWLFSDEAYRWLEHDPADRLPAGVETGPRGVSLSVMSKSFALAGLRIGWIVTHDAGLRGRLASFKDYTTICASAPGEVLALMGLRARDAVLARTLRIVAGNLPRLDQFFARWPGAFRWSRPRAGSIAFPRLTAPLPVDRFAAELVEQEGVLLLPGTRFGHPGNHFRIGFGRTDLPEALERLERFVAALPGG